MGSKGLDVYQSTLKYRVHEGDTQSKRTEVKSWYDPTLGMYMFEPTFDPHWFAT